MSPNTIPLIVPAPTLVAPSVEAEALDALAVAVLLSLHVRTVRRMDAAEQLPRPVRLGRAVRWVRAELLAWLAAGAPDRHAWEMIRGRHGRGTR